MDVTAKKSHGRRIGHGYFQRNYQGLTLIELLITLAVLAITISFGVPKISTIAHSNRLAAASNSLSGSLALARSQAITRNQKVIMCKSADGYSCTKKGGWEQGWIVFIDENGNKLREKEENLIRIQAALPNEIQLKLSAYPSARFVTYVASGFAKTNGTFTFCVKNQPQMARALILSKVGRLRKSSTERDGSPLDCS